MKESIRKITKEVQGPRILTDIAKITDFHRIQASTGYREAAKEVTGRLEEAGLDCQILSYPFDEKTWYLSHKSFLEWDCQEAWLDLESPRKIRLADFQAEATSIFQKSYPADHSKDPVDIVLLDKGDKEENYPDLDLKGKLIFIRDDYKAYMDWAIKEKGALGFVSDYMREIPGARARADLYDAKNYISFWWRDSQLEPHTFGFVLSPRQGDELARLCQKTREDQQKDSQKDPYPKARFKVDSRLYPGAIEVVEAKIPGETEEEVLLVAHLCHPRPSANDNASGVGAAMEALRVLKRLLDEKELKGLKRGIRLILVPEFAGTYAWLADEKHKDLKIVAALNLDMVGGRQTATTGPLTLSAQPHAAPSLVTDLALFCMDEIKCQAPSLNPAFNVPMFNFLHNAFSAGSDHQVFSDPTIDIPCPMLGQWPDKHYHSSADTLETLDPHILHKSASLAASYLYSLANLEEKDVFPLLNKSYERAVQELTKLVNQALEQKKEAQNLKEELDHTTKVFQATFRDTRRFFTEEVYKEKLEKQVQSFSDQIEKEKDFLFQEYQKEKGVDKFHYQEAACPKEYAYIPQRRTRSPLFQLEDYFIHDPDLKKLCDQYQKDHPMEYFQAMTLQLLVQYYIDGKRTLFEIAKEAILEAGAGTFSQVHDLVQILVKTRTVKII